MSPLVIIIIFIHILFMDFVVPHLCFLGNCYFLVISTYFIFTNSSNHIRHNELMRQFPHVTY